MVLDYVGLEFKNKYDDVELIVISTALTILTMMTSLLLLS